LTSSPTSTARSPLTREGGGFLPWRLSRHLGGFLFHRGPYIGHSSTGIL
jgi:hypothetical protein